MEKKLADLNFSNRLYTASPSLFLSVKPTPLENPTLLHVNIKLLNELGLSSEIVKNPSFLRFVNGDLEFEGPFFGSSFYAGHQFGYFVPRLGDGRAIMIGEIATEKCFFELQLKGSGLTPFSRSGDGKAVVRSSIREYLASAHLKSLNIPTTEALTLHSGDDDVYREEIEKSAIVLRVAESFLRFGHFQYLSNTNQSNELKNLVDFVIESYFPNFFQHQNQYVLFFQEITKRTAKLFARWQAVGFCHGVLNTDNMSILGLTLDYGPFGFIDNLNPNFICNHSDHEGRYSLGNQPGIGLWNLEQLALSLTSLIASSDLERTLETYTTIFSVEYQNLLLAKCGLYKRNNESENFLRETLLMLEITKLDYTNFFRALSQYEVKDIFWIEFPYARSSEFDTWLISYRAQLNLENQTESIRHERMLQVNPKFILRNILAQLAIENHLLIDDLFKVLSDPFSNWPEFHHWSFPAPPEMSNLSVSCSS